MAGSTQMVSADTALPGSLEPISASEPHVVFNRSLHSPVPEGYEDIIFGMGCFWGAERLFWQKEGVYLTMVGYAGGFTVNPTYEQACSGLTGHTEVVRVVFDPKAIALNELLALFWEQHNPTEGMRQGNDVGTQYRSAIYTTTESQRVSAAQSLAQFQESLLDNGMGEITTELEPLKAFYFAETYHQQYLARNPGGYCGLKGTGVSCPV